MFSFALQNFLSVIAKMVGTSLQINVGFLDFSIKNPNKKFKI